MKLTAAEKEQRDQSAQFARYKKAKRAEVIELLSSEHGPQFRALISFLQRLTLDSGLDDILANLRTGWIERLDDRQRLVVLGTIATRIAKVRELQGMAPFDDPLPGDPPNLFLQAREIINQKQRK
jgi:hypothetical protein